MGETRKSGEVKLPVERMGENEIKIEKLFKMFINRTNREGIDGGKSWIAWMYTYLPGNERKIMNSIIKKSTEMETAGVSKEKTAKAKEKLVKWLENFSINQDNTLREMFSEKTHTEREKTLMENQATLEIAERAFLKWKKRENKFKEASTEEWFKMWFEEMDRKEIAKWEKRMSRLIEAVGPKNIEKIRPFGETISKHKGGDEELNKKLWDGRQVFEKRRAEIEEEREGRPVVFLGDIEASIKEKLREWLYGGLNKEEIEEKMEWVRAETAHTKRIIRELDKEEAREKR